MNTWSGTANDWPVQNALPPAMANSSSNAESVKMHGIVGTLPHF